MKRKTSKPTLDKHGSEVHPAIGSISASRVSSNPGAVLFDSDIKHGHYVVVTIGHMTRSRDLNRDWLHASDELIEVAMSEAQWASFVSSMNTSAVPCTIRRTPDDWMVDGLEFAPRLAESMDEVASAADQTFGRIKVAMAAYDALPKTATAKEKREAIDAIRNAARHAEANIEYAAKSLNEHTENVVQKARADIEAMVTNKAAQLRLEAGDVSGVLELTAGVRKDDDHG